MLVKDIYPGSFSSLPEELFAIGDKLFFRAQDPFTGTELWQSDGTEAGTVRVEDINPGRGSSEPAAFTNVGGTLFFAPFNDTVGREPWGLVPHRERRGDRPPALSGGSMPASSTCSRSPTSHRDRGFSRRS